MTVFLLVSLSKSGSITLSQRVPFQVRLSGFELSLWLWRPFINPTRDRRPVFSVNNFFRGPHTCYRQVCPATPKYTPFFRCFPGAVFFALLFFQPFDILHWARPGRLIICRRRHRRWRWRTWYPQKLITRIRIRITIKKKDHCVAAHVESVWAT